MQGFLKASFTARWLLGSRHAVACPWLTETEIAPQWTPYSKERLQHKLTVGCQIRDQRSDAKCDAGQGHAVAAPLTQQNSPLVKGKLLRVTQTWLR